MNKDNSTNQKALNTASFKNKLIGMTSLKNFKNASITLAVTLFVLAAVFLILSNVKVASSSSTTQNVIASANVQAFCQIFVSNSAVNFGVVSAGSQVPTRNLITANSIGNTAGNVEIYGSNWIGPGTANFFIGNTLWNPSSSAVSTIGNQITQAFVDTKLNLPFVAQTIPTANVFFGSNVPIAQAAGTYTANVVFENACLAAGTTSLITNVIFTINVPSVCFISLSNTAITFGLINPGVSTTTSNNVFVTDPNGNTNANILVAGANWISGGNNFFAANTLWNPTSAGNAVGNALQLFPPASNLADTGITVVFPPTNNGNNIYFGVTIPAAQPAGLYTENIVLENSC